MRFVKFTIFLLGIWHFVAVEALDGRKLDYKGEMSFRYKVPDLGNQATDELKSFGQILLRGDVEYRLSPAFLVNLGIATGDKESLATRYIDVFGGDEISLGVVLDAFNIELPFARVINWQRAVRYPNWKIKMGRMENPHYRGVSNAVLFDKDLRLDGVHVFYEGNSGRSIRGLSAGASLFMTPIQEGEVLMIAQAQYNTKVSRQDVLIRAGVHKAYGIEKKTNWMSKFFEEYRLPYKRSVSQSVVFDLGGQVKFGGFPVAFYGNYLLDSDSIFSRTRATKSEGDSFSSRRGAILSRKDARSNRVTTKNLEQSWKNSFFIGANLDMKNWFVNYNFINLGPRVVPFPEFMDSDMVISAELRPELCRYRRAN